GCILELFVPPDCPKTSSHAHTEALAKLGRPSGAEFSCYEPGHTLALLQRPRPNVFAIVRAFEADLRARLISAPHRRLQLRCPCRHPEHSSAGSIESPVTFRGAGMEDFYAVQLRRILETVDFLARLVGPRITARSHHHAYRRIVRPLEIAVAGTAVDGRLDCFNQVAFEAHQNRL